MKCVAFLLIGLLLCAVAKGQTVTQRDSLRSLVRRLPAPGSSFATDTQRVQLLFKLALLEKDLKAANAWLELTERQLTKLEWPSGRVRQRIQEGILLYRENFVYQSIDKFTEALTLAEEINFDPALFAACHRQLGSAYFSLDQYGVAVSHYQQAIRYYQYDPQYRRRNDYVVLLNNVGLCHLNRKQFAAAMACFRAIINERLPQNDSVSLAWSYSNMGTAQRKAGNWRGSLESFDRALGYFGSRQIENQAFTLSEKALACLALGKSSDALRFSQEAKEKAKGGKPFFALYIAEAAYEVEKRNGLAASALSDRELYDSLKNINDQALKQRSLDGMRYAYENQQKAVLIDQQRFMERGLWAGVLVLTLFLGYALLNRRTLKRKNLKIAMQKQVIEAANAHLSDFNQALESKVQERTQELQQAYDDIKTAMLRGQTNERKRVASELHDNLGSMISAVRFQMQAMDTDALVPKERQIYRRVYEMIGNAYDEVRHISHHLLPAALETEGLANASMELVSDLNANDRIRFQLLADPNISWPKEIETDLYSILLELTNNIIKHSTASHVVIELNAAADQPALSLTDNGHHFDPTAASRGRGFANLESRVARLNGRLVHEKNLPIGNRFGIWLP